MNRVEFHDWLQDFRATFGGAAKWLSGLKDVQGPTIDKWFAALESFAKDDGLKATALLMSAPKKPTRYEDYLGEIVTRCKDLAIKRNARRDYARSASTGAKCQWCGGDGHAAIFCRIDPYTGARQFGAFSILADVQTPGVGETNLRTFGVRCVCAAGEKHSTLPCFDPEQHVVAESSRGWRAGNGFWEKVAARMERSSTAAFAGAVPTGGF